jgi:hypothetical protein
MSSGASRELATPLRRDANWKDCMIDPQQIQILRRRDGKPWVLGGGAFGQVGEAASAVATSLLSGVCINSWQLASIC